MKRWKRFIAALLLICLLSGTAAAAVQTRLIPGGKTIGMKAFTDGLVISEVIPGSPAMQAGLEAGDILTEANGIPLRDAPSFFEQVQVTDSIELGFSRRGTRKTVTVEPTRIEDQKRIGVKLRDSVAGIGTVTYYDMETNSFGALGHGITDLDGSSLIPIRGGIVVPSYVDTVQTGKKGTAGQLQGKFDTSKTIGTLEENTDFGVFGKIQAPDEEPLPVAAPEEVVTGKATILANVEGSQVAEYEIEILHLYQDEEEKGRNILLRIVDPTLLKKTGGIVQGMSGSPILQNGKLVGAVTHVLLNDPALGYGIFLDTMLSHAETVHSKNAPFFLLT